MDSFIGIRFKKETAKRFQKFSRAHFKSHTEAMATMLDFFFYNEISPKEKFGPTGRTIEATIKKRINAVIAIMKEVEKTQTKPTAAMIASLFQLQEPTKKGLILEKNVIEKNKEILFEEKGDSMDNL
ncbi:MAG: BfmA/BtgA family mobilization protein [Polaribacter sp.]|uniref:BfmA/BtgA family mobilization protein n=1 Tax=Polaribacter sp. TaxID=1920175 RepID=UPI003EF4C906